MTAKMVDQHWLKVTVGFAVLWCAWMTRDSYGQSQDIALIQQEVSTLSANIIGHDAQLAEMNEKFSQVLVAVAGIKAALERE